MIKYNLKINPKTNIYEVYFRVPISNGNRKQMHKSTGLKAIKGNKRKAEEKAREIVEKWEEIVYCDKSDMLLCEYVKDWAQRQKPMLSHTTYDNYMSMINKHITPYFTQRKLKLRDTKPYHLQEYINAKMSENLSANTVCKQLAIIKTAMQDAVINDVIKTNPANKVTKPKKSKPQHDFYTADELQKLFEVIAGTSIEIPVYLATLFGLRRSEVVGLKWSAIDLEKKTLSVCGSVTRQQQDSGEWVDTYDSRLKTEASNDIFELNDTLCIFFKSLYNHNQRLISNTDDYKEYVCVNEIGERIKLDYITQKFAKVLKANNLRHIRFHDLRHSTLSLLSNTYSMKLVQGYARHANYNITADTYCHVDNTAKRTELDTICTAIGFTG